MKEVVQKVNYSDIEIGDIIRAKVIGLTNQHFLNCNGGFKIDLSQFVTVHKNEKGLLMAGGVSLLSFKHKIIERKIKSLNTMNREEIEKIVDHIRNMPKISNKETYQKAVDMIIDQLAPKVNSERDGLSGVLVDKGSQITKLKQEVEKWVKIASDSYGVLYAELCHEKEQQIQASEERNKKLEEGIENVVTLLEGNYLASETRNALKSLLTQDKTK